MKNKVLSLFFLLSISFIFGQQKVTWEDLAMVKFSKKYSEVEENTNTLYPIFLKPVKELEGKTITVEGYFLDLLNQKNVYILSKGPMSACFFCGVGGPETAMEIVFDKKQPFKTDDVISVTGVLKLNEKDVEHFNYILTDCKATLVE